MVEWNDAKRLLNFDLFLEHDVEEWWESPVGVACSQMWATATNGFLMKFPSIPDLVERCTMLFEGLVSCVLTCAELGHTTWDETKKREMLNHAAWAQKIAQLAATYGDETVTMLPFIRMMCVPKMLDKLLADDYISYMDFARQYAM